MEEFLHWEVTVGATAVCSLSFTKEWFTSSVHFQMHETAGAQQRVIMIKTEDGDCVCNTVSAQTLEL